MPFLIESKPTLASVVNFVAPRVGFSGALSDPAGSTDIAVVRMIAAANDAAKELLDAYPWPDLTKQATITVQADFSGQSEKGYALPDDFYRFVTQTQHDKTIRRRAFGPLSPQQYQSVKVISPYVSFEVMWRYFDGKLYFLNPPSTPREFTFEYLSQGFVQDADDATLYKNSASKNGDKFLFDESLIKLLARVKWLEAMQFDSSAAARDYALAWSARVSRLESAPVLSMVGPSMGLFNPLTTRNVPETGFGT